jgi:heme/copper-type cytochrome/quinol oxidase subunit 1
MAGQSALAVVYGSPRFGDNALKTGAYTAAWAAVLSLLALLWTYLLVPVDREGRAYFETLFWGGGHIVQVAYTQMMLVSWLWLASALGMRRLLTPWLATALLFLGFAPVLLFPLFYLDGVSSTGYTLNFTRFMEYGGGIAALPIGASILAAFLWERDRAGVPPEHLPLRAALITSLFLFGAGGVLGFLITGVNTVIPAHYHGSIVGVTLAFMGMTYYLLPQLGFRAPVGRLAHWQPYIYAFGQLLHISGLAWSGFYGVARKTAGSAQGLEGFSEIAGMALMGLGGLISIIGGILFLVVALQAMWPGKKTT